MMKDEWRMNEGWMKNDERWKLNDEGWWFQAVEGFWGRTDRQTNAFATEKQKIWIIIQ